MEKELHHIAELVSQVLIKNCNATNGYRLIVTGITEKFSEQLHLRLRQKRLGSFLVVPKGTESISKEDSIISTGGLVNIRNNGDWIFIVPGSLVATLPESITISSKMHVLNNNWPWGDEDRLSPFWGEDGLFKKIMKAWGITEESYTRSFQEVIKHSMFTYMESINNHDRFGLVIDELLGGFIPPENSSNAEIHHSFMKHIGIPVCTNGDGLFNQSLIERLTSHILRRTVSESTFSLRENLYSRLTDHFSFEGGELSKHKELVDIFLDGLLENTFLNENKILGLRSGLLACDNNSLVQENSELLTFEYLNDLFEVPAERDNATFNICYLPNNGQKISENRLKIISPYGQDINISFFDLSLPSEQGYTASVHIGAQELCNQIIQTGDHQVDLTFSSGDIRTYKNQRTLTCKVVCPGREPIIKKLTINLVGPDKPCVLALGEGLRVCKLIEDEEISIGEASYFYYIAEEEPILTLYDEDLNFTEENGVFKSDSPIDPNNQVNNQAEIIVSRAGCDDLEDKEKHITLKFPEVVSGEPTLDLTLERLAQVKKPKKLKDILDRFTGDDLDYFPHLGGYSDGFKWRSELAHRFENNTSDSHYPIIVTLGDDVREGVSGELFAYSMCGNHRDVDKFRGGSLDHDLNECVNQYALARRKLINIIDNNTKNIDPNSTHPIYARSPTFCKLNDREIVSVLSDFLDSYVSLLSCFNRNKFSRHEKEFVVNLDTVFFAGEGFSTKIKLLGPWHPITVLTRFLLQKSMVNYVSDFVLRPSNAFDGDWMHLLRENAVVNSWLTFQEGEFFPTSLTTTQDSGWIISKDSGTNILDRKDISFFHDISRNFFGKTGLRLIDDVGSVERVASNIISDYTKAFPQDRRLELEFSASYNLKQVVEIVNRFIRRVDDMGLGGLSSFCPGGIHCVIGHDSMAWDTDTFSDILDFGISVFFYSRKDNAAVFQPDIYFHPSFHLDQFKRYQHSNTLSVFRGEGQSSILACKTLKVIDDNDLSTRTALTDTNEEGGDFSSKFLASLSTVVLNLFEEDSYYTQANIKITDDSRAPWVFLPADNIDPALVKKHLNSNDSGHNEIKSLWEYKFNYKSGGTSFYLLSTLDQSVTRNIQQFLPDSDQDVRSIIVEMNNIGIALSSEAQRSTSKAKGCIGIVGAVRMIDLDEIERKYEEDKTACTLIPIDSFESFFKCKNPDGINAGLLTDLLLIKFHLPNEEGDALHISAVAIEAKYRTDKPSITDQALEQAKRSYDLFKSLIKESIKENALPFRSLVLKLCQFSLRLRTDNSSDFEKKESLILKYIVEGNYSWKAEFLTSMAVVCTCKEGVDAEFREVTDRSCCITLPVNKSTTDWPLQKGVESKNILEIREKLSLLISNSVSSTDSSTSTGASSSEELMRNEEFVPSDSAGLNTLKIKLGRFAKSGELSYWSPYSHDPSIDNYGIAVTGSSGSGKTQLVKLISSQAAISGVPVMMIDYKNDFIDDNFISTGGFERLDVSKEGLPFNPLEFYVEDNGTIRPMAHIYSILSIFRSALGNDFSDTMQNALKKAIISSYEMFGINPNNQLSSEDLKNVRWPDFYNVWEQLINSDSITNATREAIESRLAWLNDLKYFQTSQSCVGGFKSLIDRKIVISMKGVTNKHRTFLSELLILNYHNYILRESGRNMFERFLVFDEAWRITKSEKLAELVRESRAFGVGILLSSQSPAEFSQVLLGNMETKLFLRAENHEMQTAVVNLLSASLSQPEKRDLQREIEALGAFQGFIKNKQNVPFKRIDTLPFLDEAWCKVPDNHACLIDKVK